MKRSIIIDSNEIDCPESESINIEVNKFRKNIEKLITVSIDTNEEGAKIMEEGSFHECELYGKKFLFVVFSNEKIDDEYHIVLNAIEEL